MTPTVTFGLAASQIATRPGVGERVKDDDAGAFRFEEALAGGKGKRKPADTDARDSIGAPHPTWRMEAYGMKLSLEAAVGFGHDAPVPEEHLTGSDLPLATEPETRLTVDENTPSQDNSPSPDVATLPVDPAMDENVVLTVPTVADDAAIAMPVVSGPKEVRAEVKQADTATQTAGIDGDADDAGPVAERSQRAAEKAIAEPVQPPEAKSAQRESRDVSGAQKPDVPQRNAPEIQQRQASDTAARPAVNEQQRNESSGVSPRNTPTNPASAADPLSAKVNVLGFSAAVAPAQPQLSATAAGLVSAIAEEPSWRQAAAETARPSTQRAPAFASPVNTLRIQLNPAELGMVTARLTANGSQLSIEIQVESNDARQRLANDSEAILKALRGIGFDVEKVTIQQASPGAQAQAQSNGAAREQFQPDQQGKQDAGARNQGGGEARRGNEGGGHGETAAERAGGGVYI